MASFPQLGYGLVKSRHIPATIVWRVEKGLVPYEAAVRAMEAWVDRLVAGTAPELLWLLEHPPLYTAGTSARPEDLKDPHRFPVFSTGRGGQYTYHGPGQRVVYVLLDLRRRGRDLRAFVTALEDWLITTLAHFGVRGERRPNRVGVWVRRPMPEGGGREDKIAAIGVRLRRWVSFHGVSLNVAPDLDHYAGIVPCGIREYGVTSLADLGVSVSLAQLDAVLKQTFPRHFGPTNFVTTPRPLEEQGDVTRSDDTAPTSSDH